ncbi:MAG: D-alanyl-D-alanine carboxypeptidase family protein [Syntrophales bacterium]|nr:D-alanyl-D-alanine carboxypeptidase family protein [Syntrophales bacterium]
MRKYLLCIVLVFVFLAGSPAHGNKTGDTIHAKSYCVLNAATGTIIKAKNIDEPIQPASLAKVLSLYVIFEAIQNKKIHLDDQVKISKKAWQTGGSQMFLEPDTEVELETLMKGMAIVSANDAATALAEYVDGDVPTFVARMNRTASLLGMKNSRFANPHGLPAKGGITTARDMAILADIYIRRFPWALDLHSQRSYSYHEITQPNRNRLLGKYPEVDGLKTGFTRVSGYHTIVTACKGEQRYIIVLMGAKTPEKRNREAAALLKEVLRTGHTSGKKHASPQIGMSL